MYKACTSAFPIHEGYDQAAITLYWLNIHLNIQVKKKTAHVKIELLSQLFFQDHLSTRPFNISNHSLPHNTTHVPLFTTLYHTVLIITSSHFSLACLFSLHAAAM